MHNVQFYVLMLPSLNEYFEAPNYADFPRLPLTAVESMEEMEGKKGSNKGDADSDGESYG